MDTPTQLMHPHERAAIAARLKADIDTAIMAQGRDKSWRLGPSSLENDCDRAIWYGYHWVRAPDFDARMRRLLEHGKLSEPRFVGWLQAAGATVYEFDPNAPETRKNKQYRVRAVDGHVSGFLDGIVILPASYGIPQPLVLELKTSGTGSTFTNLKKPVQDGGGVKAVKNGHFRQASYYGWKYDFHYSLYMSLNKNDDDLHVEIVENDFNGAISDEERFKTIVYAEKPPPRINENATFFKCKYCNFLDVCHHGADYDKSCRSCSYAQPIEGGEWRCNLVSQTIPRDFVPKGCGSWHPIGR